MRSAPFCLAAAAMTLCSLFGLSCGGGQRSAPAMTSAVIVSETRIDCVVGSRLVLPLTAVPVNADRATGTVPVSLEDGRELSARLYRVGVTVEPSPASGTLGDLWLPLPGAWTAEPLSDRSGARGGTIVALVDLPADIASSPSIVVGNTRYPLNHLPVPTTLASPTGPLGDPWRPSAPAEADARQLIDAIAAESRTPLGRWRYRLIVDGLRPLAIGEPDGPSVLPPFENPVIEAIAQQNEDRWRIALFRLWVEDADLANRLKRRLSAIVRFADNRSAPAWPTDHAALDRLLSSLLDPRLSAGRRAEVAEAWIAAQPQAVAWVIDDGGVLDAQRRPLGAVGIANLEERGTLAWAQPAGAAPSGDVAPLPPYTAVEITTPLVMPTPDATVPVSLLAAHAGDWERPLSVLPGAVPVTPPGLSVTSLSPDLTMDAWLASTPPQQRFEWGTTALLHRPAPPPGAAPTAARSRVWELLVECRLVPGVGSLTNESVRLYFGPTGAPSSVLRVDIAGEVVAERRRNELISVPSTVQVIRAADRWTFRLELPPGAVELDGLVRLAVIRTDALGRRSTWPRPMLPWQTEPGRAAADTTAWGE